ncbi:hypothetical protein EB796_009516 [Bugula neritina]|uniref:Tryptophan synthase beta chain-like PALP domain-containing protein n=1 Tax=Bugula neritina TaxID=10212 RepID=A0A7J7K0M8_BUGNE|nr:hypothetical protein EB796_009516 [Bugula neritina]
MSFMLQPEPVRQLEFIIADAIAKGHKHIITAGAVHSNHCRAVAASCAELGLQSHLFLRTPAKQVSDLKFDGNLFLDRLFGANFYLVPADADYVEFIEVKMQELAEQIK